MYGHFDPHTPIIDMPLFKHTMVNDVTSNLETVSAGYVINKSD